MHAASHSIRKETKTPAVCASMIIKVNSYLHFSICDDVLKGNLY
jgi:hypothetical protein